MIEGAARVALVLSTVAIVAAGGCRRGDRDQRSAVAVATDGAPSPAARTPAPRRYRRIDVHTHIGPDGIPRAVRLMDEWGIDGAINLSGMYPGPPRQMLETQLAAAQRSGGRIAVFANANFRLVGMQRDYGRAMAEQLGESRRLGALGMPVAIHVGDPKAFWKPVTPDNERWDELRVHPEWSFSGPGIPSWQQLYDAFERLVARHKKTTFIGVHFGNDPEDPDNVARMLDKHPNLYIDTAARVPEIGRHPQEKMKRFYAKYQDRVLFGTDTGIGPDDADMMFGSTGAEPPTRADEVRFFTSTWRYFETADRQFESPTPIQGRWKIDGVGLPEAVLRKIYFENAARVLRWRPPGT